ncbi:chemotaxis protein CheB [Mucilaginibacter sp. BJC16-A38]|uniref:chemotaxis protein CheB n=1 Tax=Mucilaginibacter phenanthrenivorans TaxID=1234842 RepID=UPI0021574120|nr:chemotaxis protein CheB [Mucilaginibacter phenanthrenivorans]MCR8561583.1 chemotaxis protein CheB [Mucilaginibacter phenanthrenivorans]
MNIRDKNPFYVVGIGLSIGGIDPLTEILSCLPAHSNAAFLIIQHLDRAYPSKLAERLQPFSKLKVNVAVQGMQLKCGEVYVLAEGQMMTIEDGKLVLRARHADEKVNKAVDILFYSMAEDLGRRAISVILSGLDGDGSLGAAQIKLRGGMTIAQLPATAQHPSMPESAIRSGQTRFILKPQDIAGAIGKLTGVPMA